jgi:hypothetical protein
VPLKEIRVDPVKVRLPLLILVMVPPTLVRSILAVLVAKSAAGRASATTAKERSCFNLLPPYGKSPKGQNPIPELALDDYE